MEEFGLGESGLDRLIKKSYALLGLISYLTAGEKETRAWTIVKGTKAPQAAGKNPFRFRKGIYPRGRSELGDADRARLHRRRKGKRKGTLGRQGIRHAGRRRRRILLQRIQERKIKRKPRSESFPWFFFQSAIPFSSRYSSNIFAAEYTNSGHGRFL